MENERHLAIGILRRYVGQNPSVFDENLIDEQGSHGQATGQSHYARGLKENKDLRIDREENFHQISIIYQHLWDLSQGITVKFKSNQTNEISTHLLLIQKQVNEIYQWSQSLPQALPSSLMKVKTSNMGRNNHETSSKHRNNLETTSKHRNILETSKHPRNIFFFSFQFLQFVFRLKTKQSRKKGEKEKKKKKKKEKKKGLSRESISGQ